MLPLCCHNPHCMLSWKNLRVQHWSQSSGQGIDRGHDRKLLNLLQYLCIIMFSIVLTY